MLRHTLSCLLLALAGAIVPAVAGTPGEVPAGQFLRDATLHGLNGPDRSLAAYRGKPLIINVWASWCGPCRAEMASLERLAWLSHPVPFAVIGISTDDDPAAALQFLKIANSTLTHYLDHDQALENQLGADRIPLTLLVDARGRVISKVRGARQWDSPAALRQIHGAFSSAGGSSKP